MNRTAGPDPAQFRFQPWRTLRLALIVSIAFTLLIFALTADHPHWQTAAGWTHAYASSLVFSLCIAGAIGLLFDLGRRGLGPRMAALTPWQFKLFRWVTPMVGVAIGMPIAIALTGVADGVAGEPQIRTTLPGAIAFFALVMALFYGYYELRARQMRAEKRATEAQLRLLQAQMEPHFLFNTLANVASLIDADTPRAKAMLESFTDYLRASLGSMRAGEHTLGDELALVEAYLRVVQIRMDDRLRYRIDVPDALRTLTLPSLSVQPLVENAIVHGLEPTIAGGSVVIEARVGADGLLDLVVTDDGRGLDAGGTPPARGHGTALANIRERLAQRFGGRGRLTLEPNPPHGVRAALHLPIR